MLRAQRTSAADQNHSGNEVVAQDTWGLVARQNSTRRSRLGAGSNRQTVEQVAVLGPQTGEHRLAANAHTGPQQGCLGLLTDERN